MADNNKRLVPVDTAWFDNRKEEYLNSPKFVAFSEITGVNLRDLLSTDSQTLETAQKKITSQSMVFNEIRREHAGYCMPLLYYTHDFRFGNPISNHNPDLDRIVFSFDQGDSLRRRHIALSYSLLPDQIDLLADQFEQPLVIKNLGSGVGMDALNAVRLTQVNVHKILNYDVSEPALRIGQTVTKYLEQQKEIDNGKVVYENRSFTQGDMNGSSHLSLLVGVICGLQDSAALTILKRIYRDMSYGGKIILTCANENMRDQDPLGNFLIQHIGTESNPFNGWGLNFRSKSNLYELMDRAGFSDICIHDDANYPGKNKIRESILNGVDPLLAKSHGYLPLDEPLGLPPKEVQSKRIGYNWIGIGTKKDKI